jgi:hypothetical protein
MTDSLSFLADPNRKMIKLYIGFIVGIILACCGTLFSIIAYNQWQSTAKIVKNGVQTQGIVVENVHRPRRIGKTSNTTALAPVVKYFTLDGQQKSYYSQTYTTPAQYQIGQSVNIWYLPNEPNLETLNGADGWILPVAFGVFGSVMCLIGFILIFGFVKQKYLVH